jgi:hypothetical protein
LVKAVLQSPTRPDVLRRPGGGGQVPIPQRLPAFEKALAWVAVADSRELVGAHWAAKNVAESARPPREEAARKKFPRSTCCVAFGLDALLVLRLRPASLQSARCQTTESFDQSEPESR